MKGRLTLAAVATVALTGSARAETPTVGVSGGVLHLDKQAATPISGTSAVGRLDVGLALSPTTSGKLRFEGFRADGANIAIAIAGDWRPLTCAGLSAAAGFSRGAESRGGNYTSVGAFGWLPVTAGVAVRLDLWIAWVERNDFSGSGMGLALGVEYTWPR